MNYSRQPIGSILEFVYHVIHISHLFVLVSNRKNFLGIFAINFDLHENKSDICLLGNDCQIVCERHSINVPKCLSIKMRTIVLPKFGREMDVKLNLKILIDVKDNDEWNTD